MELFWLWVPVLGSLLMVETARTRPISQDRPSPEDVELAEVGWQTAAFLQHVKQIYRHAGEPQGNY